MAKRNMFFELSGIEKILYAVSMVVVLCLLTGYGLVDGKDHEFLGIALMVLVLLHSVFNRAVKVGSNVAEIVKGIFALFFLASAVSGLMIAKAGFSLPDFGCPDGARGVHQIASVWCIPLCAAHVGFHRNAFFEVAGFFKALQKPLVVVTYVFACYGVYALMTSHFLSYLFLLQHFDPAHVESSAGCFLMQTLSIFTLFAVLVARIDLWVEQKRGIQNL